MEADRECNWPLYLQKKFALQNAEYIDASKVRSLIPVETSSIKARDAVDWIYSVLTTLDAKASALMRLNGVLIAAAAFLLGLFGRTDDHILSTTDFDAVLIIICALLSAISIALCLMVVNVSWNFLGKVEMRESQFDFSKEIKELDATCAKRQEYYRNAWRISSWAVYGFVFEFAWQTLFVICTVVLRLIAVYFT